MFNKNVKDVFFDYDKSARRPGEESTVQNDETFLTQHPSVKVLFEGHCDERALVERGVSAERIKTISFGKEKPFCTQDNEQCWQQNRVDHFVFER